MIFKKKEAHLLIYVEYLTEYMTQKSVVDIHRSENIYRVFRILGERKKKNNSNERQKTSRRKRQ